MKAILALIMVLFAAPVFAADCKSATVQNTEIRFTYSSFYSYYHCDFVEREAEKILGELGATDVDVVCRGGLPYAEFIRMTANFNRPVSMSEGKSNACDEEVRFRYINDSCDFHEELIDTLLDGFEVSDLEKRSSCRESRGRLRYNLKVLK